jgi:hypothetical protein
VLVVLLAVVVVTVVVVVVLVWQEVHWESVALVQVTGHVQPVTPGQSRH